MKEYEYDETSGDFTLKKLNKQNNKSRKKKNDNNYVIKLICCILALPFWTVLVVATFGDNDISHVLALLPLGLLFYYFIRSI